MRINNVNIKFYIYDDLYFYVILRKLIVNIFFKIIIIRLFRIKLINDLKNFNNNNANNEKNVEFKNEVKSNERIIENDIFSNIIFLKGFNNINIKKNKNKMNSLNNNYYSYEGNLFNLNSELIDINKDKDNSYHFTEFDFTENKNYSS